MTGEHNQIYNICIKELQFWELSIFILCLVLLFDSITKSVKDSLNEIMYSARTIKVSYAVSQNWRFFWLMIQYRFRME